MKIKFESIAKFLIKYSHLHEKEFLKKYPAEYPEYMRPWIKELKEWDLVALARLESYPHENLVQNPELKTYLQEIRQLTELAIDDSAKAKFESISEKKINPKKIHEISLLKNKIDHFNINHIVDIGGGVGHLSRALVKDREINSICVDKDEQLQKIGAKKLNFCIKDKIKFELAEFNETTTLVTSFMPTESLLIGLHCCGNLTTSVVKYGTRMKFNHLLSIGCCYHKILNEYNISDYSKRINLKFTPNALHLASRCGKIISERDLATRKKFKRYRYTLHYFLFDNFKIPFKSLGNSKKKDYEGSFSRYAKNNFQSEQFNIISDRVLQSYYERSDIQEIFIENFIADLLRLLLGRVIELYIIYDRALYLSENNYKVKIHEIFDRRLSPKNIILEARSILHL